MINNKAKKEQGPRPVRRRSGRPGVRGLREARGWGAFSRVPVTSRSSRDVAPKLITYRNKPATQTTSTYIISVAPELMSKFQLRMPTRAGFERGAFRSALPASPPGSPSKPSSSADLGGCKTKGRDVLLAVVDHQNG